MVDESSGSGDALPECFVMMPFSDLDGYTAGHFSRVYRDIVKPACEKAGFRARRTDDEAETGMIHLDIIRSIVNAPMAICDLTGHRGNVLFELGMRQAFDKPVVLIQDERTGRLFDISGLRTTPYHSSLIYHDVLADQEAIANALRKTDEKTKSGEAVNSIVSLLSISKADLKNVDKIDAGELLKFVRDEMRALRRDFRTGSDEAALRRSDLLTPPPYDFYEMTRFGVDHGERDPSIVGQFIDAIRAAWPGVDPVLMAEAGSLKLVFFTRPIEPMVVRRIARKFDLKLVLWHDLPEPLRRLFPHPAESPS